MRFNVKPILIMGAVAIALTLGMAPLTAQAQTTRPDAANTDSLVNRLSELKEQLNLTEAQEIELDRIRRDTRTQLEQIVPPEQQQIFFSTLRQGGSFEVAVAAMNLTDDQRSQLDSVLGDARDQALAVLDETQRQQVREYFRNFSQGHDRQPRS